jgi:hypothetical protein
MITGMTKNFIFHIRKISVLTSRSSYFNFFSLLLYYILTDGIATSLNKQILCLVFNDYVRPIGQKLSVYTLSFHSTVIYKPGHFLTR